MSLTARLRALLAQHWGWLLAPLLGCLAALLVAGPDLPALSTELPGYLNDDWLGALFLHHDTHRNLLEGRLPWDHAHSMWPTGMNLLPVNGGNVLEMLLSGALRAVGVKPWLALATFAIIPLNLLGFIPLGRYLWGRWGPTLAVGLAWALLPTTLGQLAAGRLTQAMLFALPLTLLGLLRLRQGGIKNAVLLGVSGAALALSYWFYAPMVLLCLPLFVLPLRKRGQALLIELAVAAATAAALTAPWWIGALLAQGAGHAGGLDSALMSPVTADCLALDGQWPRHLRGWLPWVLVPGMALALLPARLQREVTGGAPQPGPHAATQSGAPQSGPHAATQSGAPQSGAPQSGAPQSGATQSGATQSRATQSRAPQHLWLWLAMSVLCLVMAMGPAQDLGALRWKLPAYPLWRWVPGWHSFHHPDRWIHIAGLPMVLLASSVLARTRPALTWLLPLGVLLQSYGTGLLPLGTWTPTPAPVWAAVEQQAAPGAVVVLPLLRAPLSAAWQHTHGRDLVGGMVEEQPWLMPPEQLRFIGRSPLLVSLWQRAPVQRAPIQRAPIQRAPIQRAPIQLFQQDLDALHAAGVHTLVLDESAHLKAHGPSSLTRARLTRALGRPLFQDASGAIWAIPTHGEPGPMPLLEVDLRISGPAGPPPR